jgi:PIN domain nuclease of toxin-antitoxin system
MIVLDTHIWLWWIENDRAITPQIANIAVDLPEHHRDPQDRLIIATALAHNADLMSSDQQFAKYTELAGRLL